MALRGDRGPRPSRRWDLHIALIWLFALATALAACDGGSERVAPGVRAFGRDFGNLTRAEVAAAVQSAAEDYLHRPLKVRYADRLFALTPSEIGASVDVQATVDGIFSAGRRQSLTDRLAILTGRGLNRSATPVWLFDESRLDASLGKLAGAIDRPGRDATLKIGANGAALQPAESALRLDIAETGRRLREQLAKEDGAAVEAAVSDVPPRIGDGDWREAADLAQRLLALPLRLRYEQRAWTISTADLARFLIPEPPKVPGAPGTLRWDEPALAAYLAGIAREIELPARDARVEWREGRFRPTDAVEGRQLDLAATISALKSGATSPAREAALVVKPIPPAASASDWEEAIETANRAVSSALKLTFRDQAWTLAPAELAPMLSFSRSGTGAARFSVDVDEGLLSAYLKQIAKQIDRPARDARFRLEAGKVTLVAESQEGLTTNVSATAGAIARQLFTDRRTVEVDVAVTKPAVVGADAARISFPDLLMDASTSYAGSIPERAHNVELAAARINGTLVPPGAVFSFNASVGPTTLAAGFQLGYGITLQDGQPVTVPSEGGGICQVATTLFHAAFWSGLPIVQRQGHIYWISRYGTPPRGMLGLDATVDDPYLDFKFRNTTPGWLLVEATTDGANLRFALHGTKPGWEVKVEPPVISGIVKASQAVVRQEDPTMPKGRELWVEHAEDGFTARIHRTVFKDGQVVDSLDVVTSYRPAQNVLAVGTKPVTP